MEKLYNIDDANTSKIEQIASHFLASNLSLRKFCEMYCLFSHVTLREKFLDVLPFVNKDTYMKVMDKLERKRAKNVKEDYEAKLRVLTAIKLLLEQDLTVPQIANALNSTEMTIYRDLTRRIDLIEEITPDIKKEVLLRLKDHRYFNLRKGR